jgi:hypothetical protein
MAPLAAEDEPGYVDPQLEYEGCHHAPYELAARSDAARARLDAAAADGDEQTVAALGAEWTALRQRIARNRGLGATFVEVGRLVVEARLSRRTRSASAATSMKRSPPRARPRTSRMRGRPTDRRPRRRCARSWAIC